MSPVSEWVRTRDIYGIQNGKKTALVEREEIYMP